MYAQSYQIGRNGRSVRPLAAVAAESAPGRALWRENARADCSRQNLATPTSAMPITDRVLAEILRVSTTSPSVKLPSEMSCAITTPATAGKHAIFAAHAIGRNGRCAAPLAARELRRGPDRAETDRCATGRWKKLESVRDYPCVKL